MNNEGVYPVDLKTFVLDMFYFILIHQHQSTKKITLFQSSQ